MNNKTVYVLGAGFSLPAGGPTQAALLRKIFQHASTASFDQVRYDRVAGFIADDMGIPTERIANCSLEDIYTPLDRCLSDRLSLRGRTPMELQTIRDDLDYLISVSIKDSFDAASDDKSYVTNFAHYLASQAFRRSKLASETSAADAKQYDPFSIISLNWDILLDNALHSAIERQDTDHGIADHDYAPFGVVDYCCYISSIEKDDRRIRSGLWTLGCKGYNVKLLKIHGSLNWLQCSNCQRLFTAFGEKIAIDDNQICRHCKKLGVQAILRRTLIMPTFLKDLTNFQVQLVWQNASVELLEATEIVFIGYSLPDADFEFRQLLSRMVRKDAKILVCLRAGANFEPSKQRYERFFAGQRPTFDDRGVVDFLAAHVKEREDQILC